MEKHQEEKRIQERAEGKPLLGGEGVVAFARVADTCQRTFTLIPQDFATFVTLLTITNNPNSLRESSLLCCRHSVLAKNLLNKFNKRMIVEEFWGYAYVARSGWVSAS